MTCNTCYQLSPPSGDVGIYTLEKRPGKVVWYAPDGVEIVNVTLINEVKALVDAGAQKVACEDIGSSEGCCKQYIEQLCFTNGDETLSVSGLFEFGEDDSVTWSNVKVIQGINGYAVGDSITDLPTGFKQVPCQYNTTTETPNAPERTCFWHTTVDAASEIALLNSNTANGHETLSQRQWAVQQFENENDAGGGIENFHSAISLDHDGIPQSVGETVDSFINPSAPISESSTYGSLNVREGYIHVPEYYHIGANSGKRVASFEIYDAYTATNQSDRDVIYAGIKSETTSPSMDRSDAEPLAQGQQGTSTILPSAWGGQTAYIALVHADVGNSSQVNWRANITLEDGTILNNQDLRDWVWNLDNPPPQIGTIQENVSKVYDPSTGSDTWYDADNNQINFNDLVQPLQEHNCSELPLTFEVTSLLGAVTIEDASGGAGLHAEPYSFDLGKTWQSSPTYSLGASSDGSEPDIQSVFPMIRDINGVYSRVKSPSVLNGDPVDQAGTAIRITDTVGGENNNLRAVESNDPDQPGGWSTAAYSQQLGTDQMEAANNTPGLNWVLDEATQNNSYIYLGNGSISPENSATTELAPILPVAVDGEEYTVAFNPYDISHGAPNTITTFTARVVDSVTGAVLGSKEYEWVGNTSVGLTNEQFQFTGAGNPARLEFITENDATVTGNWWGSTNNVTATADSVTKTAGSAWNTGVYSATSGNVVDGVNLTFDKLGTGNAGMFGLDSDYTGTSFAGGDYTFYISADNRYYIYEDGASRFTQILDTTTADFEIDIAVNGTVTYLVNGAVVYTSNTNAGTRDYYVAAFPYTTGRGIENIQFDGTDPVKVPDSTGHYVRIDNVRLFDGKYSSSTSKFVRINNYVEARGIDATQSEPACLTKAVDSVAKSDLIKLTGNIQRIGTWEDGVNGWAIKYSLDGGAAQTALEVDGNWDTANRIYATPFATETIDVSNADEIQIWWCVWGDGDTNTYARLYDLGFEEINP